MAPTVVELTERNISVYTRVPTLADDNICGVCHVARDPAWERCWSCHTTMGQVSTPIDLVVPISLHVSYSQMGLWLNRYKNQGDATPEQQRMYLRYIAATVGRFLARHQQCVEERAGTSWDVITTVPSKTRPPPHPLDGAIHLLPWLEPELRALLRRGAGVVDHNSAGDDVFEPTEDVDGQSILLIDDTWTTGARVQSAASSLTAAGATVVAAIVIGRVVRRTGTYTGDDWWAEQRSTPFSFDVCCLE